MSSRNHMGKFLSEEEARLLRDILEEASHGRYDEQEDQDAVWDMLCQTREQIKAFDQ